jgi:hypothetical protein
MPAANFWQALSDTISRAVNLRVVTVIGDAQVQGALENLQITAPNATGTSLVTDIDLVQGDITTVVSQPLLGPDYADLRNMHQAAVAQAQAIVKSNVDIMVSIVKEIGDQLHQLPPPSHP